MILSIQVLFNKVPVTLYSVIDLYMKAPHFVRIYFIKGENICLNLKKWKICEARVRPSVPAQERWRLIFLIASVTVYSRWVFLRICLYIIYAIGFLRLETYGSIPISRNDVFLQSTISTFSC